MKKSSKKFRQMQQKRILLKKPWLKSTGPKTFEGKEISKMNALKPRSDLDNLLAEMNIHLQQIKILNNAINQGA